MLKSVSITENVAERKIIVYKSRIDYKAVRTIAEKMKTQFFHKLFFMKPKPEEVQVTSIDKYFEPYIIVDGEYTIDYSKNWSHTIQVEHTMQDLTFVGTKIKPVSLKDHLKTPCKIVKLNGVGRYKFEAKARLIFNEQWREVGLEQLPFVPFEEQPETILNKLDEQFVNKILTTEKEVELLKSKIVRRPTKILTIHNELFTVFDRAIIYKPMYNVTIKNAKTKKTVTLLIDAITGKTTSVIKQKIEPETKKPFNNSTKASPFTKTATDKVSNAPKKPKPESKQTQ